MSTPNDVALSVPFYECSYVGFIENTETKPNKINLVKETQYDGHFPRSADSRHELFFQWEIEYAKRARPFAQSSAHRPASEVKEMKQVDADTVQRLLGGKIPTPLPTSRGPPTPKEAREFLIEAIAHHGDKPSTQPFIRRMWHYYETGEWIPVDQPLPASISNETTPYSLVSVPIQDASTDASKTDPSDDPDLRMPITPDRYQARSFVRATRHSNMASQ